MLCVLTVGCATTEKKTRAGIWHTVRPGDTIGAIANRYHVTAQEIAEWNNIQNLNVILPGRRLNIPPTQHSRITAEAFRRSDWGRKPDTVTTFHGQFAWPVRGPIHSAFGIRGGRRHDGVDIGAKQGTPIHAAADGTVAFCGKLSGYGNLIILRHRDRYYSAYAHNSRHHVKTGQAVKQGDVIAAVGATGRTSGPHLHFEIRRGQIARNPLFFLNQSPTQDVRVAGRKPTHVEPQVAQRDVPAPTAGKPKWRKYTPQQEWNQVANKVFRKQ